jgi:hypothetical protein
VVIGLEADANALVGHGKLLGERRRRTPTA